MTEFRRPHHRAVAALLAAMDAKFLARAQCWFGGGTQIALSLDEYRESRDIDFLCSSREGFRLVRETVTEKSLGAAAHKPIALARELRAARDGVRGFLMHGDARIKFEIVLEARIDLAAPDEGDRVCGIQTLAPIDLAAEKLLANADRWADDSVYSRDLVDLAMMRADRRLLEAACVKAEGAYGQSVRSSLSQAVDALETRRGRLADCMTALSIDGVTRAQLWQAIRTVAQRLLA